MQETDRLGLRNYELGDTDWDHSDLVAIVDELAIDRGPIADRPASGAHPDELYYAVDQNVLWGWDETASEWVIRGGKGSSSQPLDSLVTESINNTVAYAPNYDSLQAAIGSGLPIIDIGNKEYELSEGVTLGTQQKLVSFPGTHADDYTQGGVIRAASDFPSNTPLVTVDRGTDNRLFAMVEGIFFDGQFNTDILLDIDGVRTWWVKNCGFYASTGDDDAVKAQNRNGYVVDCDFGDVGYNPDTDTLIGDTGSALLLGGSFIRCRGCTFANCAPVNISVGSSRESIWIKEARFAAVRSKAAITVNSEASDDGYQSVWIEGASVESMNAANNGILVEGGTVGPIYIRDCRFRGRDNDDTSDTGNKALVCAADPTHGIHIDGITVMNGWTGSPAVDIRASEANVDMGTVMDQYVNTAAGTEADAVAIGSGDSTGDTTVTVNHGLSAAPQVYRINAFLSNASAQDYDAAVKEVRNITATSFDVVVNVDSLCSTTGETVDLSWSVDPIHESG